MSIWFAAIDESGADQNSSHIVVSCVLGTSGVWPLIFSEWQAVLNEFNVQYYHATEFNGGRGVAAHLNKDERDCCVKHLIQVISGVGLECVAYAVDQHLFCDTIDTFPNCNLSAYDYLLATTLSHLKMRMDADRTAVRGQVKLCVEIERGCPESKFLSDRLRKAVSRGFLRPIETVSFVGKDRIPVQIADMIAYESFKTVSSQTLDYGRRRIIVSGVRKSFQKIVDGSLYRPFVIDEGWLLRDIPIIMKFLKM